MARTRFLSCVLWFWVAFIGSPSFGTRPQEISQLCAHALIELDLWGLQSDATLQIFPGPPQPRLYSPELNGIGPAAFTDASFLLTEGTIKELASTLAIDARADDLEAELSHHLSQGSTLLPLQSYLPKRMRECFNTCDGNSCYRCAFHFHEEPDLGDLNAGLNMTKVYSRYTTLGWGETLRYGDVTLFRSMPAPGSQSSFVFHAAIYLGGDLVLHKYAPPEVFHYEFSTLSSLMRTYSHPLFWDQPSPDRLVGRNYLRQGKQPFVIEFLRFDPTKKLPVAQLNPYPKFRSD